MVDLSKVQACRIIFRLLVVVVAQSTAIYAEECSIAKTNHSCTLTIDRKSPLAPPAIQMYPKQTVTVLVKNPYYFERYFMDYQSGQLTLAPDVASSIIGGLLTPLQKAGEFHVAFLNPQPDTCSATKIAASTPTKPADIANVDSLYRQCFMEFAKSAKEIYLALEPSVAPDSHSQEAAALPSKNKDIDDALKALVPKINDAYAREAQLSASITAAGKLTLPPADQVTVLGLAALSTVADAVAKDLFGFSPRIGDLPPVDKGQMSCDDPKQALTDNKAGDKGCVALYPVPDPQLQNPKMVVRQVTYTLDALNLVQNSQEAIPASSAKKAVASITIVYGDSRWEASAGTFFSTLAVRSFSVAPIIAGGVVTDKQVAENVLHPTIVPFAAANLRISNDLGWTHWRSAFYWTFAVGVNPNTVSADFASGPSLSWRGLMFSALWHYGHDVRLTQGLYKSESLGASFSGAATTENFWRSAFAIGISVRVPSLTGR